MPELPEIRNIAGQIDRALRGVIICGAEVRQAKCLNRSEEEWKAMLTGRRVEGAYSKGKWCEITLDEGMLLRLNLGMGGEFLIHEQGESLPAKWRIALALEDGRRISVNFWWFGYLHVVREGEAHAGYDSLGRDALDETLTAEEFRAAYCSRKGAIKTLLLDQKIICGIGNYYSHDIFFEAGIHPMRRACDLTQNEYKRLYDVMRETFRRATADGGAYYEKDIYNRPGHWERRLIAYRSGERCPVCGGSIEEIRTGATSGFICPDCQKLPEHG